MTWTVLVVAFILGGSCGALVMAGIAARRIQHLEFERDAERALQKNALDIVAGKRSRPHLWIEKIGGNE